MEPFDSAWLKWAQGVVNSQVLERSLNDIAKQGVIQMKLGMTKEYDPKRHCIIVTAAEPIPDPFPIQLGLLLGDVVHALRSSLDHLAWALYKRGRTPRLSKWQEQGVYFPIAATRKQFNGWLHGNRPKLPGVRRADLAIVRRFQPYKSGKRNENHVLRLLDELASADKHRVIQPIQAVPEQGGYHIVSVTDCVLTRMSARARRVPLKPGAELVRFYVRKTGPDPDIDVEPHFTIDPTINERITFEEWAGVAIRYIAALLTEFAPPPEPVRMMLAATTHGATPAWLSSPSKG